MKKLNLLCVLLALTFPFKGISAGIPISITGFASSITQTSAVLNGTVNPNGATTTGWFNCSTFTGNLGFVVLGSSTFPINMNYYVSGLVAGTTYTFYISGQNSFGTMPGSAVTFTTLPSPAPVANFSSSDTSICASTAVNFNNLSTAGTGGPIVEWSWGFQNAGITSWNHVLGGPNSINPPTVLYSYNGSQQVSLKVKDSSGVWSPITMHYIHVYPNPTNVQILPNYNLDICMGDSIPIHANIVGGTAPFSFYWNLNGISQNVNNDTIYASNEGNYSVHIEDSMGCGTNWDPQVFVDEHPQISIDLMANGQSVDTSIVCSGSYLYLNCQAVGDWPMQFAWSNGFTGNYQNIPEPTSGWYTVTVNYPAYNCPSTIDSVFIFVDSLPELTITVSDTGTHCEGDIVLLSGPSGYDSYQWNAPSVMPTDSVISATETGTYGLTMTDVHGCTAMNNMSLVFNQAPTQPTITIGGLHEDGCVLAASSGVGITYLWFMDSLGINIPIAGATGQYYHPTTFGNYLVEVTNTFSCTTISNPVWSNCNLSGIEDVVLENVSVYPNPFYENLHIDLPQGEYEISLINTLGQQIRKVITNSNIILQKEDLASGIYTVQINTKEKQKNFRVIVE